MDNNTIIELFEELKKQVGILGRKIDDSRNADVSNDAERILSEIARSQAKLSAKFTDMECRFAERKQSATDRLPLLRHIHTIDIKSSKIVAVMLGGALAIVIELWIILSLYDRCAALLDNDLKYRYVRMNGGIDDKGLCDLEDVFAASDDGRNRKALRRRIERYETAVRESVERIHRAADEKRRADALQKEAETLREGN